MVIDTRIILEGFGFASGAGILFLRHHLVGAKHASSRRLTKDRARAEIWLGMPNWTQFSRVLLSNRTRWASSTVRLAG